MSSRTSRLTAVEGVDTCIIAQFLFDPVALAGCRVFLISPDRDAAIRAARLRCFSADGELCRLRVADFDKTSGTLIVRKSKTSRSRHVFLTDEGVRFFSDACAGREPDEVMFVKADGKPWGHGNAGWYVRQAKERCGIMVHFHMLRHVWCSLAVMNGVPLTVVARNLGHVDTRMIEKTYSHLAPSYVSEAIRAGAPGFSD